MALAFEYKRPAAENYQLYEYACHEGNKAIENIFGSEYRNRIFRFATPAGPINENQPSVPTGRVGVQELSTGTSFRAPFTLVASYFTNVWNGKVAASYVTGSHAFKFGAQWFQGS